MYTNEDLFVAAAAVIIVESEMCREPRKQRFWLRPSLRGRARYGVSDFMKDLILDDADELNLEYRCGGGFRNFLQCRVVILRLHSILFECRISTKGA
jgi:hypothetical protein